MDDDDKNVEQQIHIRRIATATGLRSDSVRTLLGVCSELELINTVCTQSGSSIIKVSIPKFLKYYGRYEKTEPMKRPNKRKEKENKVNTFKNKLTPDDIIQLWNDEMTPIGFAYARGLGSGLHLKNFIESTKWLHDLDSWRELFDLCKNSKSLNGKGDMQWRVNLTWLVNYDNALKVLNVILKTRNENF
jgi:hypothetical protein